MQRLCSKYGEGWDISHTEVMTEQLHMTKKQLNLSRILYTKLGPKELPFSYSQPNINYIQLFLQFTEHICWWFINYI
jgi:hypothetical protein